MKKIVFFLVSFFVLLFFIIQKLLIEENILEIDFANYQYCDSWISNYLMISSFMFTIQSFLIPFLKKYLYDSKKYKEHIKNDEERYRPLRNLSNFLFISTLLSFISALSMFVFILVKKLIFINIAFCLGTVSVFSLIMALFLMQRNFEIMFSQKETIDS